MSIRDIAMRVLMFHVAFSSILFLSTVVKWYMLKARIEANGWTCMNPCDVLTLIIYLIPVLGPMSFLALMTTLDEGSAVSREEAGDIIAVRVGPMQYVFQDGAAKKDSQGM